MKDKEFEIELDEEGKIKSIKGRTTKGDMKNHFQRLKDFLKAEK